MSNNANHAQKRKAEAAERGGNNSSSSNKRFDHGSVNGSSSTQSQYDSRIVRVSRTSGGKDRHSKVFTAKGLRDRRVRLSVSTAIQFYDLQDRLGYDQPSKALEWLIKAAADAIEQLPALHMPPHPHPHHHTPHLPPAPALALTVSQRQQQQATTPPPPSPDVCRKSLSEASSEESHESQKAAAATTQRGVAVEAHIAEQKHDQDHGSRGRRARAAANNNSEPLYAGLSLCRSESRVNARERPKGLAINQDHHRDNEEEEKGGNDRKPKPTTAGFFTDLLQNVVSIDSQSRTSNQSLSQNKDTSQINYRDSPAAAAAAAGVSPRNSAANATGSGLVLKSQLDNVIQISSIEFPVANMKNQNEHQQIPYHHHHSQQQQNNNKPGTGSLDLLHSQSYSFPGSVAVAGTIVSPMATAHRDDNNKACGGGRACVPGLMPNPNAHPFFVNSGSATLMHGNCTTALEGGEIQSKSQAQLFHPDQMLSFPSTVARGLVSSRETLQSNSYQNSSSNSNVMNYFMLTQQQHQQMMLHRLTQQQHLGQAYDVLRIMDKPQQPLTHEFGLHESAGKSSPSPSISKLDTETHQAREKYGYS